jgi:hypothetical protein
MTAQGQDGIRAHVAVALGAMSMSHSDLAPLALLTSPQE